MARILHLSDLHLSSELAKHITGDYKDLGLIPLEDRHERLTVLRSSLRGLTSVLRGEPLDAVVITGDVSLAYDESGFKEFSETLNHLGPLLPKDPRNIVVLPGNHDVLWGSDTSTTDRYEFFVKYIRSKDYTTPLLEGIDIGPKASPTGLSPLLISPDGDFAVFAMNSANYCGSLRSLPGGHQSWDRVEAWARRGRGGSDLARAFHNLRLEDIPRVSELQMSAMAETFEALDSPAVGGPLRIVALHHHLLPLSASEEFKAFESLTNLGQVRASFATSDVSLVLHGHKHVGGSYIDRVVLGDIDDPVSSGEYLVSASATVWARDHLKPEFARLIDIRRHSDRVRTVTISSLPYRLPGSTSSPDLAAVAHWIPRLERCDAEPVVLSDITCTDVYGRVTALFDGNADRSFHGLTCVIEDGATALEPPAGYPAQEGVDDLVGWFKDLVDWWQSPYPDLEGRARGFNHGERIRHYRQKYDQIQQATKALADSPGTTRGVVQLIDQEIDSIADPTKRIPSFFTLEFLQDVPTKTIHCIAQFRKQEMELWWPINVCEIARLQAEVIEGLRVHDATIWEAGSITTVAGVAMLRRGRPRVLVPKADQIAQKDPGELWGMAYDLVIERNEAALNSFLRLFEDWRPIGQVEPDGTTLSLTGLTVIAEAIGLFADRTNNSTAKTLARRISDLHNINFAYADGEEQVQEPSERKIAYEGWQTKVDSGLQEIKDLAESLVTASTQPTPQ